MLHCSSPVVARLKSRASSIPGELILKASVWLRPGITPCVKTCASRERAELFSPFSSFDHDGQCCSFLIQRNRDKLSTRKFDVGVFTQPGPSPITARHALMRWAEFPIRGFFDGRAGGAAAGGRAGGGCRR